MKSRLFNVLAGIALLLSLASAAAWIMSHRTPRRFDVTFGGKCPDGGIDYLRVTGWGVGFGGGRIDIVPWDSFYEWDIPFWRPMAVGMLYLLLWSGLPGWLKRKPRSNGLCASCGYDLRATPDRCPECGTIPAAQTK
jgi:hypothetical protein